MAMASGQAELVFKIRTDSAAAIEDLKRLRSAVQDAARAPQPVSVKVDSKRARDDAASHVRTLTNTITRDIGRMEGVSNRAFASIGDGIAGAFRNTPLLGQPIANLTRNLFDLEGQSKASVKALQAAAATVQSLQDKATLLSQRFAERSRSFTDNANLRFAGRVDPEFLRSVRALTDEGARFKLIASRFGDDTAKAFIPVQRAALQFEQLERRGITALDAINAKVSDARKSFSDLELQTARASSKIGDIGKGAALAGALVAAGAAVGAIALFGLAKRASEAGSEIFDLSQRTNISAEALSAIKFAAEQSGSSVEVFAGGIDKFNRLIGRASLGSKEATEALIRLGVDPQDALNDNEAALAAVIRRINELPAGAAQAQAATAAFGKGGTALIATIRTMEGDLEKFIKRAKELGVVLTQEDVKAADDFGDTLDALKAQARGIANTFALQLAPDISAAMASVSASLERNKDVVSKWGGRLEEIFKGAKIAYQDFRDAFKVDSVSTEEALKAVEVFRARGLLVSGDGRGAALALRRERERFEAANKERQQREFKEQGRDEEGYIPIPQPPLGVEEGDEAQKAREKAADQRAASLAKARQQRLENETAVAAALYKQQIDTAKLALDQITSDESASFEQRSAALVAYVAAVTAAEDELLKARIARNDAEITLIGERLRSQKKGDRITDAEALAELDALRIKRKEAADERTAAIRDAGRERIKAERAINAQSLSDLQDTNRRAEELFNARSRTELEQRSRDAEAGKVSFEKVEEARQRIEADALTLRFNNKLKEQAAAKGDLKALTDINHALALLENERAEFTQGTTARIIAERGKDTDSARRLVEDQRDFNEQLRNVWTETAEVIRASQARSIELLLKSPRRSTRLKGINEAESAEIAAEEARANREAEAIASHIERLIQAEREKADTQEEFKEREKELIAAGNARIEREEQRHEDEKDRIRRAAAERRAAEANTGSFSGTDYSIRDESGAIVEGVSVSENALAGLRGALNETRLAGKAAFGSFAQGVGSMIGDFVLLGKVGPQAFRKLTAQILSDLAKQAVVKALMALADGFVFLFTHPAKAAASFTAAGLYAAVAGAAAIAGRSAAGNIFNQNANSAPGAGGGRGSNSRDNEPRLIEQGRNQVREVVHILRVESSDSHILNVISKDIRNNGSTRGLIIETAGT